MTGNISFMGSKMDICKASQTSRQYLSNCRLLFSISQKFLMIFYLCMEHDSCQTFCNHTSVIYQISGACYQLPSCQKEQMLHKVFPIMPKRCSLLSAFNGLQMNGGCFTASLLSLIFHNFERVLKILRNMCTFFYCLHNYQKNVESSVH